MSVLGPKNGSNLFSMVIVPASVVLRNTVSAPPSLLSVVMPEVSALTNLSVPRLSIGPVMLPIVDALPISSVAQKQTVVPPVWVAVPVRITELKVSVESTISSPPGPEMFPEMRNVAPLASRNPPVTPPRLIVLARMKLLVSVRLLPLV